MKLLKWFLFFTCVMVNLLECQCYKACKKTKAATNWDSDWYFQTLKKGHFVIATSECQNCENGDTAWQWLRQRTTPTKLCFRVYGVTPEGYFSIDSTCEMNNPDAGNFNCDLDFSKYETTVRMKGSASILLTDNENYAVANFCIFGKENIWYIISPKPSIDPTLKAELLEKIIGMGFNSNEAVEGVSPVFLKNSTLISCKD